MSLENVLSRQTPLSEGDYPVWVEPAEISLPDELVQLIDDEALKQLLDQGYDNLKTFIIEHYLYKIDLINYGYYDHTLVSKDNPEEIKSMCIEQAKIEAATVQSYDADDPLDQTLMIRKYVSLCNEAGDSGERI